MNLIAVLLTAFTLAGGGKAARIVVDTKESDAVVMAAEDLRSDIRKITGLEPVVVRSAGPRKGDVFISTKEDGRWEAYDVSTSCHKDI